MYILDLDELNDENYFYNNNYEIPSYEFTEEKCSEKDVFVFTYEEKNNLYNEIPQQSNIQAYNEIHFNFMPNPSPTKKIDLVKNNITKTTNDHTFLPIKPILSKAKIFKINKIKKSRQGRKKLNQVYNNEETHTKYSGDNIAIKIKRNNYNNYLKHINLKLRKSKNPNLNNIELKKIDTSIITVSKKEENLELLDQKIKDTLSNKISSKYLYLEEDYNKKKIEFILQQNDKDINYELNLTNREILDIYCNNKKDNLIFKDFKTLDDDLKELKKKNDDKYIKLYEYTAKNFEQIINAIFPRRKRKK